MDSFCLPLAIEKIVGQAELFILGTVTNLGEEKLWIEKSITLRVTPLVRGGEVGQIHALRKLRRVYQSKNS